MSVLAIITYNYCLFKVKWLKQLCALNYSAKLQYTHNALKPNDWPLTKGIIIIYYILSISGSQQCKMKLIRFKGTSLWHIHVWDNLGTAYTTCETSQEDRTVTSWHQTFPSNQVLFKLSKRYNYIMNTYFFPMSYCYLCLKQTLG